ncbi:MAG: ABC transporter permease [Ruminiclostridium sp.]
MKTIDILKMCFRNLTKHKARTFLTVTGVVIGTCAIIVMISLGVGMNEAQTVMLNNMADLTLVRVYNYGSNNPDEQNKVPDLTDDVLTEFKQIDHVKAVTPFYQNMSVGNEIGIANDEYAISWGNFIGCYMDEMENFGYKLQDGRWKNSTDPKATVIFGSGVGSDLVDIYDDDDETKYHWTGQDENGNVIDPLIHPLTDSFRIVPLQMDMDTWMADYSICQPTNAINMEYGDDLNVVGVLEGNYNDYNTVCGVFIDISYMKQLIEAYNEVNEDGDYTLAEFKGVYNDVRVRVDDMNNVEAVEQALKDMGYQTSSNLELRNQMTQQTKTIQLMLGALAAISLFVAALNITNTMVMSIIERTKEIGIMKVLGCDVGKIKLQFLLEAALIGFIGGVVGIGVSYGVSAIVNAFLSDSLMSAMGGDYMQYYGVEGMNISVIPIWLNFAALAFATLVGLVSGFYPASKGTKISALAAISHE